MSGGGGGKAIAHLIETADQAQGTLMVNSTPTVSYTHLTLPTTFPVYTSEIYTQL